MTSQVRQDVLIIGQLQQGPPSPPHTHTNLEDPVSGRPLECTQLPLKSYPEMWVPPTAWPSLATWKPTCSSDGPRQAPHAPLSAATTPQPRLLHWVLSSTCAPAAAPDGCGQSLGAVEVGEASSRAESLSRLLVASLGELRTCGT